MGNVITQELGVKTDDDNEYINLPTSVLLNPLFLQQKYRKLPKFDGTEEPNALSTKKVEAPSEVTRAEGKGKDKQVMNLFAAAAGGVHTVENSPALISLDKTPELEEHEKLQLMQLRLFLRIHLAYVRRHVKWSVGKGKGKGLLDPTSGFLPLRDSVLRVANGDTSEVSEATAMAGLSAGMCLAMARSLGRENPAIFIAMAASMTAMLQKSGPFSLASASGRSNGGSGGSMVDHTARSIFEFAQQSAHTMSGEARAAAIGLMLAVAVCRGSVHDTLAVAAELTRSGAKGEGDLCLPAASLAVLQELKCRRMRLLLSYPDPRVRYHLFATWLSFHSQ